ncbi:MAG: hypothetical protein ACYSTY_02215, partial [Planctomycetota bacterium]
MSGHASYWLVLVGLAALAAPVHGRQCEYGFKVLDLGYGTCQGCNARAIAVNDAGQVVGTIRVGDPW